MMGRDSATRVLRQSARCPGIHPSACPAGYCQRLSAERSDPDRRRWRGRGCQPGDVVELAVERDRIAAAAERSHDHDRLFQRSYPGSGRQAGDTEGDDFLLQTARTHSENETTARDRRQSRDGPGENGSGTAEQVRHDHRGGDVAGCAQNEPQCGVGVDALGEVGMVGKAARVRPASSARRACLSISLTWRTPVSSPRPKRTLWLGVTMPSPPFKPTQKIVGS